MWKHNEYHCRVTDLHPCCSPCRTITTGTGWLADIHPSRRLCSLYILTATTISHSYSPLPEIGHLQYGCQRAHYVSWKPSNIEHEHTQHRTADPWYTLCFCKTDTIAVIVRGRRNGEWADSVLWWEVRKVCTASMTKTADQTMLSYSDWNRAGFAKHFEVYVGGGRTVVVYTDHNPLTFLHSLQNPNQRLMRWCLFLQPFNLDIRHIKGSENIVADALSRALT